MARKREVSIWAEVPGWLDRDMAAIIETLRSTFAGGATEVHEDVALPDGRRIGEVAFRACAAVRSGRCTEASDLAADVAITMGTVLDNGWHEFRQGDGTERHGTLAEAAASAGASVPKA